MADDPADLGVLVARAQYALRLTHRRFGQLLGASERTAERWAARRSSPTRAQAARLIPHLHPVDPELAAALARKLGTSLEAVGITVPVAPAPPAAPMPDPRLVGLVIAAAAEVMDVSPRVVRPVLQAAFARARELGLDVVTIDAELAPPQPAAARAGRSKR